MGVGKSRKRGSKDEQVVSKKIDAGMQKEAMVNARVIKLLLLGAGESGKSTLFKQMRNLYGDKFEEQELLIYKPGIHRNIIQSCKELYNQARILDKTIFPRPEVGKDCKEAGDELMKVSDGTSLNKKLGGILKTMWKDEAIQTVYKYSSEFQMIDSIDYFMTEIDRICEKDYIPSFMDSLRCRIRTTGIVETKFEVEKSQFTVIDVGGQRSERKKWLHCFQDVTAVVFVAAVSEYNQVLFEDAKTNRLKESLSLFRQIVNYDCFRDKTSMILFLNKSDILKEKIKTVPLKVCGIV
mmetsp:Transcript_18691/g.29713  ORF Transcript_18691/g.29713 Transcript_18691/m.29713 type:complete len:295 (-) Transcript_18691:412-1296(-)